MKKVVMLIALILGTSVMATANTIPLRNNSSKEVSLNFRKHKHSKKAKTEKTKSEKPVAKSQK